MGLTGVIYAAIVVAWAAYLVPLALRRQDQVSRKHSIERFSSAMRVLSRRGTSASSGRVVVAPARAQDRVVLPSLTKAEPAPAPVRRPSKAALRAAAARRRRVLAVLLIATATVVTLGVLGVIAWWWFAVPLTLTLAFLYAARRQVRRASEAYWTASVAPSAERSNVVRRSATRVEASDGAVKREEADPDDEDTVKLSADQLREAVADSHVSVVAMQTADGGSLWDPVPVTLPTYVDKPVAQRSVRRVDLDAPDTWSSGHSAEASATAQAAESPTVSEDVDEPRVANG